MITIPDFTQSQAKTIPDLPFVLEKVAGKREKGSELIRYDLHLAFDVGSEDVGGMVLPAPVLAWRQALIEAADDRGPVKGSRIPKLAVTLSLWSMRTDDPNELERVLDEYPATLREVKVAGKKNGTRLTYVFWVEGSGDLAPAILDSLGFAMLAETSLMQQVLPFTPKVVQLDEELPPEADEEELDPVDDADEIEKRETPPVEEAGGPLSVGDELLTKRDAEVLRDWVAGQVGGAPGSAVLTAQLRKWWKKQVGSDMVRLSHALEYGEAEAFWKYEEDGKKLALVTVVEEPPAQVEADARVVLRLIRGFGSGREGSRVPSDAVQHRFWGMYGPQEERWNNAVDYGTSAGWWNYKSMDGKRGSYEFVLTLWGAQEQGEKGPLPPIIQHFTGADGLPDEREVPLEEELAPHLPKRPAAVGEEKPKKTRSKKTKKLEEETTQEAAK